MIYSRRNFTDKTKRLAVIRSGEPLVIVTYWSHRAYCVMSSDFRYAGGVFPMTKRGLKEACGRLVADELRSAK